MILGIDAGNHAVKVCGQCGLMKFISFLGEARDISLKQIHGEDDMVYKYEGRRGFAGSLAMYESEFGGTIMGDSKAHEDTKIRVLIGIHQYITKHNISDTSFKIVVGQPISKHLDDEKVKIKEMLIGKHTIEVNGIEKTFYIEEANVSPEGAASYWSNPYGGTVRIVDVGSGTVNYSTIIDGRYLDRDSGTIPFGVNTNKSNDIEALARGIAIQTMKKWNSEDKVLIVGGVAEKIEEPLKRYYHNAEILYPIAKDEYVDPVYANVIAFIQLR